MRFVNDWRECMDRMQFLLSSPDPCFISRIGGSDTNAVAALLEAREAGRSDQDEKVMAHRGVVEKYNGYYDLSSKPENYIRYLNALLSFYETSTDLFVCNFQLLSMYLRDTLHPTFYREDIAGKRGFELLVQHIGEKSPKCAGYPYQFVEKLVSHPLTLFNALETALCGRRVLVVSPFARSIEINFGNRKSFFRNYSYPDFSLVLCNTPITYSGLPLEFYPQQDWFETVDELCNQIAGLEFDIALLSCGSYALPLGSFISTSLGKKAVYVGGVLQLFFGIIGRRYEGNAFFEDQIEASVFIRPVEGERYLQHASITLETAREAFGAYF